MIEWYSFALISAVFSATAAITQKKILFKEKALTFTTILALFNLIIAIPFFFLINWEQVATQGILILFLKSILGATSFFLVMLGIKNLEISKALPILVLTPGLVAIFAFIFLNESLSKIEILGIILLALGTYILSLRKKQKAEGPFEKAINPKGHYYIIFALILLTITSILDKTILSNFKVPINAFMGFQHLFFAIFFLIIILFTKERKTIKKSFKKSWKWILLVSFITITYRYTYIYSVKFAPVALALSLKRISVFIAVIIGGRLFKEHSLPTRIIATIILIAGVILIING